MVDLTKIRTAELAYISGDLPYYISTYVHIEDKDAPGIIVHFDLWEAQRYALVDIDTHRLNIILKARQLGVTWLVLAYVSWCLLCNRGWTVIGLSRTEEEAKELVRRLGNVIFRYMPELIREDCKENAGWDGTKYRVTSLSIELTFPDGSVSTFKAFPSASGAGRSFTANILVLDEWAFQQGAEEIWLSVYPTINRPTGGKVIGLSTIERGTLFEQLYTDDNNFNKIFLPWDADPRRDAAWYERTRRDLGNMILQEYPATVEEALTIPGGAYFPEFKRHLHVVHESDLTGARRYVCIDYGLDMLSAHWVAILADGKAVVYKEYDAPNLAISDACKSIIEHNEGDDIYAYLAPPDLWSREQVNGRPRDVMFYENGVTLTKTSNDLDAGCAAIKEWLKSGLVILDGAAPNLCRCLTKIQRDKNRPNVYAKQPHDLTHDVDSLRCFCVYWTAPAPAQPRIGRYTPDLLEDWENADAEIRQIMTERYGKPY